MNSKKFWIVKIIFLKGKNKLFFIVGSGHCGTKWLATTLNSPEHQVKCVHEFRNEYSNINWMMGNERLREQGLYGFKEYFEYFKDLNDIGWDAGDSNSFSMDFFMQEDSVKFLKSQMNINYIHVLIRNGIRTVNSKIQHSLSNNPTEFLTLNAQTSWFEESLYNLNKVCLLHDLNRNDFISDEQIQKSRKNIKLLHHSILSGQKLPQDYLVNIVEDLSPFHKVNTLVRWGYGLYNSKNLNKLQEIWGDKLLVWRLEDLTENTESLHKILSLHNISYTEDQILKLQKKDVNKKIATKDIPTMLQSWSKRDMELFKILCEDTMKFHKYDMEVFNSMLEK